MKRKWLSLIFTGLFVWGLAACASSSSSPSAPASSSAPLVGGYTEDRDLTDEDREIFDAALEGLVGVEYEPLQVATQVVAGTNYRFYAKGTTVTAEPEEKFVYIYVFQPLDITEQPTITEIVDVKTEV